MLHRLTPLFRSDLPHWMELLDRLAPTPETHPSLVWFVRPADDDVAIGRYVRTRAFRDAFHLLSPGRLAVICDCFPSTLNALVTLQNLTRRGTPVPLGAILPEQAHDVAGVQVERVIPCRLFEEEQRHALRLRYGANVSSGSMTALPSDAWHVAMVLGRAGDTPWVVAVALMDWWLFWAEVVERDWLQVAALVEMNLTVAQVWQLPYVMSDGMVGALYGEPARMGVGWRAVGSVGGPEWNLHP